VLNRIILIGRLTRDPELRYVPSGQPVAGFTLAVDRPFVNQQGERATDFIDIVAWRKLAEQVTQHLSKGRLVAVEGRLQIRSYETQDGQKRKVAEVVADAVRFLDRKGTTSPSPEPVSPETAEVGTEAAGPQEDVPF
jgi:single-strand DNA-binding protein